MSTESEEKRRVADALLRKGWIKVQFDPNRVFVTIPPWFRGRSSHVILQFGYNMPVPIPDLAVDEVGISGTLHFDGKPYLCFIPWTAVSAVVDEKTSNGLAWALPSGSNVHPVPVPVREKNRPWWFRGVIKGGKRA